MEKLFLFFYLSVVSIAILAAEQFVIFTPASSHLPLVASGVPCSIYIDSSEDRGVMITAGDLRQDILQACGEKPEFLTSISSKRCIIAGTHGIPFIKKLTSAGKIDKKELDRKSEKYILQVIANPCEGIDEAVVIIGSDRHGTIYGIYKLPEQMGISPWYWWADAPVTEQANIYIKPGQYPDGESAVTYRGISLNDEASCLTRWVKHTYSTNYSDHRLYMRVCELILRLKGSFLRPAMWSWAFYAGDPQNSKTASEMGVITGMSHHEPMACNHQEWSCRRKEYGAWDYTTNQKVIDQFFREGIERIQGTEDIVTIDMRGDGDAVMSKSTNVRLLENIIENQRKTTEEITKRSAKEAPQVWALCKEVLDYYDKDMRVPDDVIMLLCDDNWDNVCRLPNAKERKHPGGWGMYYHTNYVGAPRNSKWLNVTPIQSMWEQLQLTYDYGVEKLWILNVGDLRPTEYPITLFMDMARDPKQFDVPNLLEHPRRFCVQQFGEDQADEAMRILNLYSKYNGRVTGGMLDRNAYNLEAGEWKQVSDEYLKLKTEALRQYISLKLEYKDVYKQLILLPVQAMANLYEMYYTQAMNHKLYKENNPQANEQADRVEQAFARDKVLSDDYSNIMSGGEWENMTIQKHIGYTSWNGDFPAGTLPKIYRIENPEKAVGGYIFTGQGGYIAIETEHYYSAKAVPDTEWTVILYMGRILGGMALMSYTRPTDGAFTPYKIKLSKGIDKVTVHVIAESTPALHGRKGHEYSIGFEGGKDQTINFNHNLNELSENVYSIYYPTVARRIVEKKTKLNVPNTSDDMQTITSKPPDPGIVLEKLAVDYGDYKKSCLFMNESKDKRESR